MIEEQFCFGCGSYGKDHPNSLCEEMVASPTYVDSDEVLVRPPLPANAIVVSEHIKMLTTNLGYALKGVAINRDKPAYIRIGNRFEPIVDISASDGFVYVEGVESHMNRMGYVKRRS